MNELLLKNHDIRTTRSAVVPEAHANANKSFGPSRDYGRKQDKDFRRGSDISSPYNRNKPRKQNCEIDQKPTGKLNDICHRYGLSGY